MIGAGLKETRAAIERVLQKKQERKDKKMADQALNQEKTVVEPTSTTKQNMSYDQVEALMKTIMAENREAMRELVVEMKKPTVEEADKQAKQKAKELREVHARVEVGKAEEKRRTVRQINCPHKRPDGSWAVSGQEFSYDPDNNSEEGLAGRAKRCKLMCLRCQKFVYEGPSSPMFAQGIPVNVTLTNVQ